jgi:hypothetical protein
LLDPLHFALESTRGIPAVEETSDFSLILANVVGFQ